MHIHALTPRRWKCDPKEKSVFSNLSKRLGHPSISFGTAQLCHHMTTEAGTSFSFLASTQQFSLTHGEHGQEPVFSYLASENVKQSCFLALRDLKTLWACVCTRVRCTHMWTCTCFRRTRRREKKRQNHQLRPHQGSLPATNSGSRFSEWLLFTKHFKARPLCMWRCICGFWCVKSPFWFVLIHIIRKSCSSWP